MFKFDIYSRRSPWWAEEQVSYRFFSVTADDSFYAVPREQYFEDLSITSYTFVNLRK